MVVFGEGSWIQWFWTPFEQRIVGDREKRPRRSENVWRVGGDNATLLALHSFTSWWSHNNMVGTTGSFRVRSHSYKVVALPAAVKRFHFAVRKKQTEGNVTFEFLSQAMHLNNVRLTSLWKPWQASEPTNGHWQYYSVLRSPTSSFTTPYLVRSCRELSSPVLFCLNKKTFKIHTSRKTTKKNDYPGIHEVCFRYRKNIGKYRKISGNIGGQKQNKISGKYRMNYARVLFELSRVFGANPNIGLLPGKISESKTKYRDSGKTSIFVFGWFCATPA